MEGSELKVICSNLDKIRITREELPPVLIATQRILSDHFESAKKK